MSEPYPKPLDALEAFIQDISEVELVGDLRIELHRLVLALMAPLRLELDEALNDKLEAQNERDAAQRHANNLGDALAKAEEEIDELKAKVEDVRKLAWDLYRNREGLEEDGERLSEIHNALAAILKEG